LFYERINVEEARKRVALYLALPLPFLSKTKNSKKSEKPKNQ